ncbi:hypothetical protein LPTSP4_35990 [Leptospira ryugenii]|uniref:Uncharacterized protein n=1 Tax=Leptospira ryugenii TaxID=1917863 RepID=A0A2P2E599_9LEPT|nr:hypothetical protein [Leptospira ryugenii]GBF52061.1 hypothetical protein LPTSP4_35990 [Leptospira ryugenii]
MSEPVLLAMLFADRVITENNNKKGIIGTFDRFMSGTFPAIFPPWAIYTAFTNIVGKHNFALTLTYIEANQVILPINGEFDSVNAEGTVELSFNLGGLAFPKPGKYNLSLHIDGELIGSRALIVDQIKQTAG